tara:strand:- start:916 stop:1842 length:927 start_codon:yes stop_codon:yes gene_type:complete
MNTDVKILLKKGFIFMLPILAWITIVVIVDPFNYFNISQKISEKAKLESAQKLNSLLYNVIDFKNSPSPHIIIGDSRIRKLPTDRIKELSGDDYHTLHANAAKLNEIIDLFWVADAYSELENVILGVNFNLYNEYAYSDRVTDAKELIKNPLIYIFNLDVLETVYLAVKNEFFGIKKKEKRNGKLFWEYTINTVASNHYSKWKKPENTLKRLKELSDYCKQKNINLTLLIVPHHKEFHDQLIKYDLSKAEINFKNKIKEIGKVIDYDFPNRITNCKDCFGDPLHATDSISKVIIEDLFSDTLIIGKVL